MRLASSAVAQAAAARGLQVLRPATLKSVDAVATLAGLSADVMVVAAYGLILPEAILQVPRRGCLNIHASLLPRWRGAAPIQRALLAGDSRTGVTIMQMDAGLDTGAVLLEKAHAIGPHDTAGDLTEALARLGAQAIVEALARLDELTPREQGNAGASYAKKVSRADARVDWNQTSVSVERQVRAFNPVPGAEARVGDESLKVWNAEIATGSGRPGEVLVSDGERLVIACGEGAVALVEVQRPGGKRMAIKDFLRGAHLAIG